MGGPERMDQALNIAESQLSRAPVMVCSAMGGVTDRIISTIELAAEGRMEEAMDSFSAVEAMHHECARAFLNGTVLDQVMSHLDDLFSQYASILKGVGLLRECSPRSRDALLSFGERLSTRLIQGRAELRGIPSKLADARAFIRTDENFSQARPDMPETLRLTRQHIQPQAGTLVITQGFIASGPSGVTTTLGRGGSDYSASILGAALNAEEIQIWTDVTGIMTCDPRIIPGASTIPEITYLEAGELAFFGAKVVHPATIQPAVAQNIPVWVKNTSAPEEYGTRIASQAGDAGLKALSVKKNITVVSITSSRMLEAHGFLKQLFAIFDAEETPVDLVSTSEVSVSMTIERTDHLERIVGQLEELGEVSVEKGLAIICMVGRHLWKDAAFPARAFGALKDIPIRMISLGASEVNLSVVVPEERATDSLQKLHNCFFA